MHKSLLTAVAFAALSASAACAQPAPSTPPNAGGGGHRWDMLAQADTNHDGNVTRAEWDKARGDRFAQEDANHDGQLSADERPHWGGGGSGQQPAAGSPHGGERHHAMNADSNGDGVISRAEYDAQSAAMFQRLDANSDDTISAAELQAARDHMHQH